MGEIRAVLFDLDGTLVRYHGITFESSWGAIAGAAGVEAASRRLLEHYLPRRDAYAEWVREDAALLAGIDVARVTARIFPPPLADGVREAVVELRGRFVLGIVSSGVDLVADRVCADLGLDFAVANRLCVSGGRFTGKGELRVDLWKKADVVREIAAARGLALDEICYVGDHVNDLPVMGIVGLGIAVHAKDPALEAASAHVASGFSEIPRLIAEHAAR
ncbi:MAG: HAD family phosphatase [Candidatus Bipolaricaulota bacterium]|nr:MAG: HAD family phosphatase [Candidatus Bipolaricaulota bacterium]